MFSVLKCYWSEERDKFERETKTKVSKENFLCVYAAAHIHTFTTENIKACFWKTGFVLFNPDVITAEMMAPSLESSSAGVMPLFNQQGSPVRAVSALLQEHVACKRKATEVEEQDTPVSMTPHRNPVALRHSQLPQTPSDHCHQATETPSPFLQSARRACA